MRLSLEKFGFVSPQNALWSCQMAAVSSWTAENLPAPSQHWQVSSPNRQGQVTGIPEEEEHPSEGKLY